MARSHKYISRAQKRERGMITNIWDRARSLQEKRVAAGEEKRPLREIIKDEEFRRNWETVKRLRKVHFKDIEDRKERRRLFEEYVEAESYWDWWEQDDDGDWHYVG